MIERIARKKQSILSRKKLYFCILLTVFFFYFFPPFYAQEQFAPVALHSLALLFLRATFAIRSRRSLQKSNRERFAQVAHDKRAMGAIRLGCS